MRADEASSSCCFSKANDSALSGVEVRVTAGCGRGVWSREQMAEGAVVFSNLPSAHVLTAEFIDRRCSFCFSSSSDSREGGLHQCGKCKYVRYWADWTQHKTECASLMRSERGGGLLEACGAVGGMLNDVRLLLRLSSALLLARTLTPPSATCRCSHSHDSDDEVTPVIECCADHVLHLCSPPPHSLDPSADSEQTAVVQLVCHILSRKEIQSLLRRFHNNNFGITDSLLQCIGAGVYPAAALLNHSCQPTCLLRYDITPGRAVTLKVVAVGHGGSVEEGQQQRLCANMELTHSYVDLAQPTAARQDKLHQTYGFYCTCARCCGPPASETPPSPPSGRLCESSFASTGSIEKVLQLKSSHGPRAFAGGDELVWVDVESAIVSWRTGESSTSVAGAFKEAALWQRQAAAAGEEGGKKEAAEEARCLEKAVSALRGAVGPFHFELYKVHGQLMTARLLAGNYAGAVECCFKVCGYLQLVLGCDVPRHPLLGLQLYTLGDLLATEGRAAEALHVYTWSLEILRIAFGSADDLVLRLEKSIGDIRSPQP